MPDKLPKTVQPARFWFGAMIAVVVSLSIIGFVIARSNNPDCEIVYDNSSCLQIERVSSQEDIELGLSGRESLPQDAGMLFEFQDSSKYCFWMKDMNFPLDIIWLNDERKVVTIKRNLKPESYPDEFCPIAPAKFVLEVNAGVADKLQF